MLAKGCGNRLPFQKNPALGQRKAIMIASKSSFEPQSSEPLPNSSKVYVSGQIHPELRVPLREIKLTPTKSFNGKVEANAPVRVYDCSGSWGDSDFHGEVERGLPALRREWILQRGD